MKQPQHSTSVIDVVLRRLHELGVHHLFGVPGDYNLWVLDQVLEHPEIDWIGTATELGAAYAADGYARCHGFAAVLTTYGVGELNAANAVAGSYAEYVPLLHIVIGPTSTELTEETLVHHSLGIGDPGGFARAARQVVCAEAFVRPETATAEVDRVITTCLAQRRPGYLLIPSDVALAPAELPRSPLVRPDPWPTDPKNVAAFTEAARKRIASASSTVLLADGLVERFGARAPLAQLLTQGRLPHAILLSGKAVVDEHGPQFLGLYAGAAGPQSVRDAVEEADLLIRAGMRLTDINTSGFSHGFNDGRGIDLGPADARIDGRAFANVPLAASLQALTPLVAEAGGQGQPRRTHEPRPEHAGCGPLTQDHLWRAVVAALHRDDVIAVDQGTAMFGIAPLPLPSGALCLAQPLWASIGYSLPALLGAQFADRSRRGVLLIGDGSAQVTFQELGAFGRYGLTPLVILVNNDGYSVERTIHGLNAPYNDIPRWRWCDLPAALGVPDPLTFSVRTADALDAALAMATAARDRFILIEAHTAPGDVPTLLRQFVQARQ
ncbi:alpha-keto acid decarboxylase family protein [Streptomyces buecherae]|uniref:Alpha-keto-acid decarboxylase n=1 Tax=Streptomyces buecherae TaxID=2763006 RepID=A0A7H8N832_9ACTN|nr:thiamine pyrophosphate-binding protein [Streptomyces buecherae]QKW49928.1 alpha-keto acid decarboxylase family protein [Streptomyces buecherae]